MKVGRPRIGEKNVRSMTVSARMRPAERKALEKMAKGQRRKVTEMARVILIERLINESLLPADA